MEIKIELKGLKEALAKYDGMQSSVLKAAAMSINRAAATGKTAITQEVRQDYTLKAARAKEGIDVSKANMRWLTAVITVGGKTIPLQEFKYKGTGKRRRSGYSVVQVMVKKSGGFKPVRAAFEAKGRYGTGLFVRRGKARGPLRFLKGPSMAGMVKDVGVSRRVLARISQRLNTEFNAALSFALNKGRITGGE